MSDSQEPPPPGAPKPETPAELRAAAAERRAWARHHLDMARTFEDEAKTLERRAALAEMAESGNALTITYPEGTVDRTQMQASSPSAGANISAAKSKARLPFQRALIKRNLSLPEWARAQRKPPLEVETAKAWLKKTANGRRRIPRSWADRIEAEFLDEKKRPEVPATLASWPNGIAEGV